MAGRHGKGGRRPECICRILQHSHAHGLGALLVEPVRGRAAGRRANAIQHGRIRSRLPGLAPEQTYYRFGRFRFGQTACGVSVGGSGTEDGVWRLDTMQWRARREKEGMEKETA